MSIHQRLIAASLATVILSPAVLAAQHQEHRAAPGQPPANAAVAQCAQAQPLVARTIEAATARLEAARLSNGPSHMRAAIDELQGALRDLRAQLAPCAAMQPATSSDAGSQAK